MKLQSMPGFPTQISANGFPTNFVLNQTPGDGWQVARILGEGDFEVLFQGQREECREFLRQKVDKEFPGLMEQQ